MTAYPFVLHLGPLEITGYGLMMLACFLVAAWLVTLELRRLGFREDFAGDILGAAVIGGIVGAKLWYVALTQDLGSLLSRGGLVYYGGFLGGVLGVLWISRRKQVPIRWTMHLVAPALAAGYSVGRIGCFLVGDDYGRPTDLPWGVAFPQGLPPSTAEVMQRQFGVPIPPGASPTDVLHVHPTQLYETALMLLAFAVLWPLRRHAKPVGWLFGLYLVLAGLERFGVEILRAKDDRFLGGFTLAQLTSVGLVTTGVLILGAWKQAPAVDPGPYLGAGGGPTPSRS